MSINKGRQRRQPVSITGRDGYLVLQALAYAIVTIEALPEAQQEWSNKEQMKELLYILSEGHPGAFLRDARCHIEGIPPQLSGWSENVLEQAHNA
jgi:hypothetical protein